MPVCLDCGKDKTSTFNNYISDVLFDNSYFFWETKNPFLTLRFRTFRMDFIEEFNDIKNKIRTDLLAIINKDESLKERHASNGWKWFFNDYDAKRYYRKLINSYYDSSITF